MRCSACGVEGSATARFCEQCGARLARACPQCNHEVGPEARFCPECGRALALAEELGMRPLQAHCHLSLGRLYRQTGRLDEARDELSIAVEMLSSMEMSFWLPEARAELARTA